jgi:hypothetical protein
VAQVGCLRGRQGGLCDGDGEEVTEAWQGAAGGRLLELWVGWRLGERNGNLIRRAAISIHFANSVWRLRVCGLFVDRLRIICDFISIFFQTLG